MSLVMCPLCTGDDEVHLVEKLADGRRRVECRDCDYQWDHGDPVAERRPAGTSLAVARSRFPTAGDVHPEARLRAEMLKAQYLGEERPEPDPRVAPFWSKYQLLFSEQALPTAPPEDLKRFANDPTGVYVGFMTSFNNAWNEMGEEAGAALLRQVVAHLLRGTRPQSLEDRLTQLIKGTVPFTMPGFKEALLTKTLCVVYPDKYMTIVTYDQKRIMAKAVYGLDLPAADRVAMTIGRLIVWSNDLLSELVGEGFAHQQHAADFLWWAKDRGAGA
ncbi:hypothetical protein GCM10009562_42140 [Nocardioides aquaticus]|nr:hypothetical protein [Nocardioides aquaticus]